MSHKLCTEVGGVTTDACQNCSVRTFLNLSVALFSFGLALIAFSLIDQVSMVNLFYFCLSLCGTTQVLYRQQ